jgi:hypothetical protein
MFAAFPLLFQARAFANASAYFEKLSQADKPASPAQPAQPVAVTLDPEARRKLVAAIAANIAERYVNRAIGKRLADLILAHDKNGDYDPLDTAAKLAASINAEIRSASPTLGIPRGTFVADVMYSARPLPEVWPPPMTEAVRERQRAVMRDLNCMFEKVEKLPRNVGYIKLNGMADAAICSETTARVMASLNETAALIIDVRDNPGSGAGQSVSAERLGADRHRAGRARHERRGVGDGQKAHRRGGVVACLGSAAASEVIIRWRAGDHLAYDRCLALRNDAVESRAGSRRERLAGGARGPLLALPDLLVSALRLPSPPRSRPGRCA